MFIIVIHQESESAILHELYDMILACIPYCTLYVLYCTRYQIQYRYDIRTRAVTRRYDSGIYSGMYESSVHGTVEQLGAFSI